MKQNTLEFLYEEKQRLAHEIKENRQTINTLLESNREKQKQLRVVRTSLIELLDTLIRQQGSLYAVCKKYFGYVDKRFYRLYNVIDRKND